jgi:hypothetical protein
MVTFAPTKDGARKGKTPSSLRNGGSDIEAHPYLPFWREPLLLLHFFTPYIQNLGYEAIHMQILMQQ